MSLAAIERALGGCGLVSRGAFHPEAADAVPPLPDGGPVRTLVLAGNAGGSMWPAFAAAKWTKNHPLDHWSRGAIEPIAARFGGVGLYPGGPPPWLPFLRWAQRGGPVYPSAMGILIHPEHGLWHAYRGAIALPRKLDLGPREESANPCQSCDHRVCLTSCAADAYSAEGYDVAACVAHVDGADELACAANGCAARRACPVGRDSIYPPAQAAFHMAAFLANHRKIPAG